MFYLSSYSFGLDLLSIEFEIPVLLMLRFNAEEGNDVYIGASFLKFIFILDKVFIFCRTVTIPPGYYFV